MNAEKNLEEKVKNTTQANREMTTAEIPVQADPSVFKYNEEWVAFVTKCSMHARGVPDDFARCPRVWNQPRGA